MCWSWIVLGYCTELCGGLHSYMPLKFIALGFDNSFVYRVVSEFSSVSFSLPLQVCSRSRSLP
jgi:hypothetical protein